MVQSNTINCTYTIAIYSDIRLQLLDKNIKAYIQYTL